MSKFYEQTLSAKQIFSGKIIRVEQLSVKLPNGKSTSREVVYHPGAVAIVAETADGRLVFVEQFRKATEDVLFEIPAGKLEQGETPAACAARELAEETGYRAQDLRPVYEFFTSPGFSNEKIYLFYATGLIPGEVNLDDDEFVGLRLVETHDLVEKVNQGQIEDAKTLVGLLWWFGHKGIQLG